MKHARVDGQRDDAPTLGGISASDEVLENTFASGNPSMSRPETLAFKKTERRRIKFVQALRRAKAKARACFSSEPGNLVPRQDVGLFPRMNTVKRIAHN